MSKIRVEEVKDTEAYEEELLDYEEEEEKAPDSVSAKAADTAKKGYVGIHSSGFRDFLLKPELLRAIIDSGFEHPSEGKFFCHERLTYITPFVQPPPSSIFGHHSAGLLFHRVLSSFQPSSSFTIPLPPPPFSVTIQPPSSSIIFCHDPA
ncbi:hypothetical protein RCOM_0899280 [Ricinus communis]|uniref:DEAD-box RNA helicase Q domain-containing protein n=1 Tax=Ricinus communis TaxID=3988 RepID=B9RV52_RICCO|nr:hypothetical protein RCOM_0899280 [Ricinus communis]